MKRGSYCTSYNKNYNESNDMFRIVYNAVSENNVRVTDYGNFLTDDNYIIHEKHIIIENSNYYLSYMKNTGKQGQDASIAHCDMDSNLRSVLMVKNTQTLDTIYSFTKAAQISGLLNTIRLKQKI